MDVCINGNFVNKSNTFLNCSTCWKCLRTLTTLDYYKKLHHYENIFELKKYYKEKDKFLKTLNNNDPLQREIIELYKNNNKIDNLKKNEWLALKSHWKLSGNKLTSTSETFLKKKELHSSHLDDKLKIKIPLNKEVLCIKDYNKDYYLASHPL